MENQAQWALCLRVGVVSPLKREIFKMQRGKNYHKRLSLSKEPGVKP
jgi:hypothetical protein